MRAADGSTADGSSHSEAGGGAVEAQVQANKTADGSRQQQQGYEAE
jgi:hypothetical protein